MRRFEECASLARQESESWSEQAAQVRTQAQTIDRELGQPFFVWLSEREGADAAIRIATPQTPEEAETLRDRAHAADAPIPGEVKAAARGERAGTKADMTVSEAGREVRTDRTRDDARKGRAGVAVETEKPFEHHATENLLFIGEWLAGQLFGTAKNAAPDGAGERIGAETYVRPDPDWRDQSP